MLRIMASEAALQKEERAVGFRVIHTAKTCSICFLMVILVINREGAQSASLFHIMATLKLINRKLVCISLLVIGSNFSVC